MCDGCSLWNIILLGEKEVFDVCIVEISSIEKDVGNVRDVINVVFSTGYIIYMHAYINIYSNIYPYHRME